MQIVIDISDDLKDKICNATEDWACKYVEGWSLEVARIIRNGTPLPKGHGDLIDLNALKGELWWVTDCPHTKLTEQAIDIWEAVNTATTVIPTDEVD